MIVLKRITTANMNDTAASAVPFVRSVMWTGCPDPDAAAERIRRVRGRRRPGYGSVPVIMGPAEKCLCAWVPEWCKALDGLDSRDYGHLHAAFDGRHVCSMMAFDAAYADGFKPVFRSGIIPARISEKCMRCGLNRNYNLSVRDLLSHYSSLYDMYRVERDPGDKYGDVSWPEYVVDFISSAMWRRGRKI